MPNCLLLYWRWVITCGDLSWGNASWLPSVFLQTVKNRDLETNIKHFQPVIAPSNWSAFHKSLVSIESPQRLTKNISLPTPCMMLYQVIVLTLALTSGVNASKHSFHNQQSAINSSSSFLCVLLTQSFHLKFPPLQSLLDTHLGWWTSD